MRNELELLAVIEKYLNKELSAEEKAAFEKQMAADPQLQESVMLQQQIVKGIERAAYKQHIQTARTKFRFKRNFIKWGVTGVVVATFIIALFYYFGKTSPAEKAQGTSFLPEYNELHQNIWADADKRLTSLVFSIESSHDTLIETKNGIILQIPANGFLDENGLPVTGQVMLTVKEALDAASIMQAGLSSKSGDQLLESAGMFYIDARQNGKMVSINPDSGLYMEVPTDSVQVNMKLYKGNRLANGTIDWINPQPLDRSLTPMDISLLNFYPPHYLDSLAKWGYDTRNKKFTDSLYYSFAAWFQNPPAQETAIGEEMIDSTDDRQYYVGCAVNPAKIKAIWKEKFQHTLIATREFEERLYWIHQAARDEVLDLYVNNLNKKLFDIDSMAAKLVPVAYKKQFLAFAARRDGAIKINERLTQRLQRYYATRAKAYMEAITKTNKEFWAKQDRLDNLAYDKEMEHTSDSIERITRLFTEELTINLKAVYNQLGYDTTGNLRLPDNNVYKARITSTGWYNIDQEVYESTRNRTSATITDSATGKTAMVKYQSVTFQIREEGQYDWLYVYLLPDKLSSFIRISPDNGTYKEKLNELMKYKLVCVGYRNGQAFFYSQPGIEPKAYAGIELTAVSQRELKRALNREGGDKHEKEIRKEINFFLFNYRDMERQRHKLALQELMMKVVTVIFPCEQVAA